MITPDSIEQTYSFFHQKRNVYIHSTNNRQKDDIEYAISSYTDEMNEELYNKLSDGNDEFLRTHACFAADIDSAVKKLGFMLGQESSNI